MSIRKALSTLAVVSMVSVLLAGLTPLVAQSQPPPPPPAPQAPPPPPQPRGPQQQARPAFGDVFGRFRVSLPPGATPMGATYNFTIPASQAQVGITAMTQDQMFQATMQNFPNMMQQMGATIESNRRRDVRGKQGQFVVTTLKDPQSEMVMRSLNVFVPGPNVWVQVTGPAQNAPQLDKTLEMLLKTIQL
jgi:hypothetical protein